MKSIVRIAMVSGALWCSGAVVLGAEAAQSSPLAMAHLVQAAAPGCRNCQAWKTWYAQFEQERKEEASGVRSTIVDLVATREALAAEKATAAGLRVELAAEKATVVGLTLALEVEQAHVEGWRVELATVTQAKERAENSAAGKQQTIALLGAQCAALLSQHAAVFEQNKELNNQVAELRAQMWVLQSAYESHVAALQAQIATFERARAARML